MSDEGEGGRCGREGRGGHADENAEDAAHISLDPHGLETSQQPVVTHSTRGNQSVSKFEARQDTFG